MSGETGEKTEQPSPKRLRDARDKGQVARSQEVVTTVSLFGVIAVCYLLGDLFWNSMVVLMDQVALLAATRSETRLQEGLALAWDLSVAIMLPILGVALVLTIAANMIQFGVLFSVEAALPNLERVSIIKGFERLFSMHSMVELLKSVFKILFLSFLLYFLIRDSIGPFMSSIRCGLDCIWEVNDQMLARLLFISAVAFVVVAGLDFMIQRHLHTKQLMMTKDEVKREYKESEGDPIVKGQRRALAQELAMSDGRKQVQTASAVIVNPTHLAVAIRYTKGDTPLPIVTAKGRERVAVDMRAEAERAGVPVFRNVPLARHLYAATEPGDYVPDAVFEAVAEVLAWVARHEATLYRGTLGHGAIDMERGDHRADLDARRR